MAQAQAKVEKLLHAPPIMDYTGFTKLFKTLAKHTKPNEPFDVLLLSGAHGLGKSQWARDLARALGVPAIVEIMSGKEPTDIIGNPFTTEENGLMVTKLAPPSWFNSMKDVNRPDDEYSVEWVKELKDILDSIPKNCRPERVLCLDEFNRPPTETFGPMMNMVLTGEHHGERMKYRTLIVLAGNNNKEQDDTYNINEMDPAQKDRVREVEIIPSLKEWVSVVTGKVHPGLVNFVSNNPNLFNAFSKTGTLSLRTSTSLGKRLNNMSVQEVESDGKDVIKLFMPAAIAGKVMEEVLAASKDINPDKLLLEYPTVQQKIKDLVGQNNVNAIKLTSQRVPQAMKALSERLKDPKVDAEMVKNCMDFLRDIPRSLSYGPITHITRNMANTIIFTKFAEKACNDPYFQQIFEDASVQ